MNNYSLALNEGIIIQCDKIYHNKKPSELILTNLNLICVETNSAIFKKSYNVLKIPVNQIKVIDGQAQAFVVKENGDWVLQVLLRNKEEKFIFSGEFYELIKKKQEAIKFIKQISLLLTGKSASNIADTTFIGGVKNILGSIGVDIKNKQPNNVTAKCIGCMAPLSGQQGQTVRCEYCDTEQTL